MQTTQLGRTGVSVSAWCLGSMTWGTQTAEADGHAQIDLAIERGINFIDTAEMYPVNPISAETLGRTEEIIGNWIAKGGDRDRLVLATKITGEGSQAVPGGPPISARRIREAAEASLRRLRTDRIDLYQLHWPNRGSYMFRKNWTFDPSGQDRAATLDHMHDVLGELQRLIDEGKIRHFGLSNESAWGTAQWLRLAEEGAGPRAATIQNEYSLLCRLFDTDLAELSVNEDVTLLAFSPLAAGLLSGKYQDGCIPEGSRRSLVPGLGGRMTDRVLPAAEAYLDIARRHALDPVQMAVAWTRTRPFPAIPIIGATTLDQLRHMLDGAQLELSPEVLEEIAVAHKAHPMPY